MRHDRSPLKKGQKLEHEGITATERFTQHPPRYTEASLVRKLEELGIGRPFYLCTYHFHHPATRIRDEKGEKQVRRTHTTMCLTCRVMK